MVFNREADFEEALIKVLFQKGWEKEVIKYPSEQDLINNWANILFENNKQKDRLNDCMITEGEMQQILEQITALRTPLKLNGFINGTTVTITRDNPQDTLHFGKEVSLKIYDRKEIAAGQSRYQIVQQPVFSKKSKLLNDRRGDLMLLINGMPVIHLELKKSGIPVSRACEQIKKYAYEGVFSGLFSLIQIFVAMTPEETLYFANPGPDGVFNSDYFFHWADFNNNPMNDWKDLASHFINIPMAHELIGFYTVADSSDGILKVMRSYQYYAANAISDRVSKMNWEDHNQLGGYVWHTTGSGKTMTSFKSAQLIAASQKADKVIFLTDRIELGTQSFQEYSSFANENESVQSTENTAVLIGKLKSSSYSDTLIVTSIQKMSNIQMEDNDCNLHDIETIRKKRMVFIVDEAHRSTFGDMLVTIKQTFPKAIFFGFTGTPIENENSKKDNTTASIFGNELHRYSIAHGIGDRNVLGFDIYKILPYEDREVRKAVALHEAKADTEDEVYNDKKKSEIFHKFMDKSKVPMAGIFHPDNSYTKGIEDYIPDSQYETEEYRFSIVNDMKKNWKTLSHSHQTVFHAMLATSSISEAIEYYRLFKKVMPELKTTCLFDPNIDNNSGFVFKEEGLKEIIEDYNKRYGTEFTIPTHALFKKDISLRLAHKSVYKHIAKTPEKQLDLLIVVDQMLTGFDSKWINTLYLDKMLRYENLIQAFSRTNRLFGHEKPFGIIRYYRRPHTMERDINRAIKLYSGDRPLGLFVDKLPENLNKMNHLYQEIQNVFVQANIPDFDRLPDDATTIGKFVSLFNEFNSVLDCAKIQGFQWNCSTYSLKEESSKNDIEISMLFDETNYFILTQRYKEISSSKENTGDTSGDSDVPFDLVSHITEVDTGIINAEYMNSRFEIYRKELLKDGASKESVEKALNELHKTFATLSAEEQHYANIFLHDVQRGDVTIEEGKTLRDYITEYQCQQQEDNIHRFASLLGVYEEKLRELMNLHLTEANINEFGRLDDLKKTVDKEKAKQFFEKREQKKLPPLKVNMRIDKLLRTFILSGGFDIETHYPISLS